MTTKTTAQKIAALYSNDGQISERVGGVLGLIHTIDDECWCETENIISRGNFAIDPTKYTFADCSSIVIIEGVWDYGIEGCAGYCWEGNGCECDDEGPTS